MAVNSTTSVQSYDGSRATERGTKIVRSGNSMDKNAFLKILSAELSNQNPDNTKDSGQFITQLAQFTSMEQTSNLNNTMEKFANNSMVGKAITSKSLDSQGKPYTGIVKAVTTENGTTKMSLLINNNGTNEYKDFTIDDIASVLDVQDSSLSVLNNLNLNNSFLLASSFMGKDVELSEKDSSDNYYQGNVIGVYKDNGQIKIKLQVKDSEEIIDTTFDKITKVGDLDKMSTGN
jgi:flagellar basal-body rod modification protein FlgD